MKRNIRVTMISLAVVLVVGIGLYFWVYDSGQRENDFIEYEEAMPQSAQGQKIYIVSDAKSIELTENQIETEEPAEEQNTNMMTEEQEPEEVTLIFAGDIYLSSYVLNNYNSSGIYGVVSEPLLTEMQQGDITIANQEFPFSLGGTKAPDKQFNFRVDPMYTKIFSEMGIDLVGLANNHALDYGTEALTDTFTALKTAGIAYVGAGDDLAHAMQPSIIQAGQRSFGFLAASRVIPEISWNVENQQPGMLCTYDSALLCQAIQEAAV